MDLIIKPIVDGYNYLMDQGDPRVKDWFLMSSPFPTMFLSLSYAIFVTKIGPKLMENRKPFKLNKVLIVYNAIQVAISTWIFYEAVAVGWFTKYSPLRCEPVDFSNDPDALRMARGCWWYFMSKFTEFFDTFFFVMRKKYDHISTLHVIHHGIMPVSVWWGVKYFPGGQSTFFGFLNTFVHIIMYTYYMLSAMGPKVQKYLWWKKHLTLLQMVQFVLVVAHSLYVVTLPNCDYPKSFNYYIAAHAVLFYFLFSNFYKQTYNKKQKKNKEVTQNGNSKAKNGVCFVSQKHLYETADKENSMKKGYTTETTSNLRNRAFIDKKETNMNGRS